MVFLAETLTDDARIEFVQSSIGFDYRWVVPRVGRSGGLVLYWKAGISSEVGFFDVKKAAIMADCRRKAVRIVCIHGLNGVELEN